MHVRCGWLLEQVHVTSKGLGLCCYKSPPVRIYILRQASMLASSVETAT